MESPAIDISRDNIKMKYNFLFFNNFIPIMPLLYWERAQIALLPNSLRRTKVLPQYMEAFMYWAGDLSPRIRRQKTAIYHRAKYI